MNEPLPDAVVAASRLRAAVEETAAALAGADLDRLLASDALLQKVLTEIPRSATVTGQARAQLRREVEATQVALRRSRRLGAALMEFVRCSLDAREPGLGYDTRRFRAPVTGRALNERV